MEAKIKAVFKQTPSLEFLSFFSVGLLLVALFFIGFFCGASIVPAMPAMLQSAK